MFLSYLSFFIFLSCLFIAIVGLTLDPKAKFNRAFVIYTIIISIWSFADIFYNLPISENAAWFWYKVEAIGWCGMIFAIIYMFLVFSNYYDKTPLFFKVLIIVYPIFLYILILNNQGFVKSFSQGQFGKIENIDISSISFYMVYLGSIISSIIGLFFVFRARKKSTSKRYKAQAKGLIIVSIISSFFGPFSNIAPTLFGLKFPPLGSLFVIIFIGGIFFLMNRYRLMRLDFNLLKNEISDSISDIVVIISPEQKILEVNKILFEKTNYDVEYITQRMFSDFIIDKEAFAENLNDAIKQKEKIKIKQALLKTLNGIEIPISILICPIFDKFDDYIGAIIICKMMNEFEKVINLYKISPQEKKITLYIMQGLSNREIGEKMELSEGTVKNYIYNIYKKTNSSNRIDLVQLFSSIDNYA